MTRRWSEREGEDVKGRGEQQEESVSRTEGEGVGEGRGPPARLLGVMSPGVPAALRGPFLSASQLASAGLTSPFHLVAAEGETVLEREQKLHFTDSLYSEDAGLWPDNVVHSIQPST